MYVYFYENIIYMHEISKYMQENRVVYIIFIQCENEEAEEWRVCLQLYSEECMHQNERRNFVKHWCQGKKMMRRKFFINLIACIGCGTGVMPCFPCEKRIFLILNSEIVNISGWQWRSIPKPFRNLKNAPLTMLNEFLQSFASLPCDCSGQW